MRPSESSATTSPESRLAARPANTKPELDLLGSVETMRAAEKIADSHRGPGFACDNGFQNFQQVDGISRPAGGLGKAAFHQAVRDAVPGIEHDRRIEDHLVARDLYPRIARDFDQDGRRGPQKLRLLVEQLAFAHHFDRSGAPGVENKSEPPLKQVADARIGQKTFLFAAGKSEQPLRLTEPAGDLGVLTQVDIPAGTRGACGEQSNSEGSARNGHQALLLPGSGGAPSCGPRSSSSELFSNLSSMSRLPRSAPCKFAA